MGINIKLECCESPITLEELPANYGHQFIGRCDKCGNSYGIEDLTEITEELEDAESDNDEDDTVYHCNKCDKAIGLSDFEAGDGKCVECVERNQ